MMLYWIVTTSNSVAQRGMDWAEALEKWAELTGAKEGFYVSQQARNNKHTAVLCAAVLSHSKKDKLTKKDLMFQIYRYVHGTDIESLTTGKCFRGEKKWTKRRKRREIHSVYVIFLVARELSLI